MILIVDYEMGNVGSIINMLRRIGVHAALSSSPRELIEADGIILPGVGAFDTGMQSLHDRGLIDCLTGPVVSQGIPMLGICLGMQLLTCGSEEGQLPGLGLIEGYTHRISSLPKAESTLRVPHMGWNDVHPRTVTSAPQSLSSLLFNSTEADQRYYFVHSYHVQCSSERSVLATTTYGQTLTAAIGSGNVAGTQFHPEKSLRFGLRIMQNFAEVCSGVVAASQ